MIEVLKILANKITGRATTVNIAMILLYMLSNEESIKLTSIMIVSLAVFFVVMQWFLDKKAIDEGLKPIEKSRS